MSRHSGYAASLLPGMLVLGIGITVALSPLANVVMSAVPEQETALASGVNNSISRIAGLVILSIAAIVLTQGFGRSLRQQLQSSTLPSQMQSKLYADRSLMTAAQVPSNFGVAAAREGQQIVEASFTSGYSAVMDAAAVGMLLAAMSVVLWWKEPAQER
jgi:TRAP-type mannitol/chloroaromatic compound transport system permease large subunit